MTRALKDYLRQKPAWHWASDFRLDPIDGQSAKLVIRADQPEIAKFARLRQSHLLEIVRQIASPPWRIEIDIQLAWPDESMAEHPSPAAVPLGRTVPSTASASMRAQAMQDPVVRQVMEMFHAGVIAVFPLGEDPEELAAKAAAQAAAAKRAAVGESVGEPNQMSIVKPPSGPAIADAELTEEQDDV